VEETLSMSNIAQKTHWPIGIKVTGAYLAFGVCLMEVPSEKVDFVATDGDPEKLVLLNDPDDTGISKINTLKVLIRSIADTSHTQNTDHAEGRVAFRLA
jgi:hypothetical protein